MCGITGFLLTDASASAAAILDSMTDSLAHRGPDDRGTWHDESGLVHLGHRRLSILDLSERGHQPMVSQDARYVLVYNGETYNFPDIRDELEKEGVRFVGHSDTEVLLEGFSKWGIEKTLRRMVGMWAFAVWDREEEVLILARDRLGEKPLYYGWMGTAFIFGSELKALTRHPQFVGQIDPHALRDYLRYGYVPTPRAIWRGIHKLPPGTVLRVDLSSGTALIPRSYWEARTAVLRARSTPLDGSGKGLEELLERTVKRTMVADVPIGVFLSGGIDSSLVAALAQKDSDRPVRTFTIGFTEAGYDEAEDAKKVAEHLGTDHKEFYVSAEEARVVATELPMLYDEPFADSSQIPTHLVSRLARRHVAVALSGDGGDELFGGYNRYVLAAPVWQRLGRLPYLIRRPLADVLTNVPKETWNSAGKVFLPLLGKRLRSAVRAGTFGEKAHKLGTALRLRNAGSIYPSLLWIWQDPHALMVVPPGPPAENDLPIAERPDAAEGMHGLVERMMLLDTLSYLPDDIMVKVDRASMGVSLETRAPFLSHEVFEHAWTIPIEDKIRDGRGKIALRRILAKHVPEELFERPKTGFAVPIGDWLRGPMKDWAEELLSTERLTNDGLLHPGPIRAAWEEHLSGRKDRHHEIWVVLMFQAWLDFNRDKLGRKEEAHEVVHVV